VGRLQSALRIRPGEGSVAFRFVSLMFVGMTGAAIGANGVESLFFSRFGPEYLPYLYIVLAVVTFGLTIAVSSLLARPNPAGVLLGLLAGLVVLLVGARATLAIPIRWVYPVTWIVMMVAWTAQVMASWGLAGAVHDTRQAKRLFPLYGSGLILGAVFGGLATGPLASLLGAENLVVVWAVALSAACLLGRSISGSPSVRTRGAVIAGRRRTAGPLRQMANAMRVVNGSTLLRAMALALTLFAVLYFSLAVLFAEAATERFPRTEQLAGFLGLFMGVSNAAALVVSLLVANRLFARFGVPNMVMALAVIYVVGFAGMAVRAPFAALVTFRLIQMVWVNGVWATGWQALFNVVPSEHRASIRGFMDGGPLQAGVLLSGILLLLGDRVLSARGLYVAGAVGAVVAVWAMWRARRAYLGAVGEALRAGNPDVFRHEDEPFAGVRRDADVVAALVSAASGPDPVARRVAMEILGEAPSPDAVPAYVSGLSDPDPQVRVAAVQGLGRTDPPEHLGERLASVLRDPDGEVRASAAAELMDSSDDRGTAALLEMARSPDPTWRAAAVVRVGRTSVGNDFLLRGLSDPDPLVRGRAAGAAAAGQDPRLADGLVGLLADPEPGVREAAASSLARAGSDVGERLIRALARPETEEGALLALARLPGADPEALRAYARGEVVRAVRYHELWRQLAARAGERLDLVAHAVRHRTLAHAQKALRAATALHPKALDVAIEALDSRDPQQRANALEMLETGGERDLVRPLLPVWETLPARDGRVSDALGDLVDDEDPWVRACARYAAEENERDGTEVETLSTLSLMDRMLFLRRVGLFEDLSPPDLKHVAEVATEHVFPEGHVIAAQGEPGDDMHIVVEGEIEVVTSDPSERSRPVARRGSGEYVGEMAILDQEPRMASLIASRETRTLSIDRRRFQRILRERPEASLAVMHVLSQRLRDAHASAPTKDQL
jgi:HEAT repeat protein